ncbi:PREDICTED: cyclin-T1-5 [Tarenaya hassleriana]|uniref:cyclin-T1-5 n=1 Tax=Tarenaya hassleriana TaxID=28532 RepID=UPI0008FD6F58|nr:PREDICTED: cyclin-T1-5 [Tarenaya hassleriana]
MTGMLPAESSHCESGTTMNSYNKQAEVGRWYFSRKEIEEHSPSRRDGIDLKREIYLRKSYCTFLQDLGMRLKVPQVTIATAIIFCHRFFICQSHAKNDRRTIATVCMFLAGKVEETPRPLKDVIVVSYEIIHKKDPAAAQRIKQKEVYEQQKELILSGEKIVLSTLGFDFNILHPYKPLVEAIKRFKVAQNALAQVAWNFVNDGLRTSLCLQFKPHHIAAGAIFLAAKFLKVKLPSDGEKLWWQEFDITPRQLEALVDLYFSDVSNQMLELYEQNRAPSSQGSEVESSAGAGVALRSASRNAASMDEYGNFKQMSSRLPPDLTNSDNHSGPSKANHDQNNDNGSGETGSVITEHKGERDGENKDSYHPEDYPSHRDSVREVHHKSRSGVERTGKEDSERTSGDHRDDSTLHKSRNVDTSDVPVSQSPKDLKLLRDTVKAKLEKAKKLQGERTRKKDLMDDDDLIERELEDVELAAKDDKTKRKKRLSSAEVDNSDHMGSERSDVEDENSTGGKGDVANMEEGEMVSDASPMTNS